RLAREAFNIILRSADAGTTMERAAIGLIAASFFLFAVWLGWTGYIGSDDGNYAAAAIRWLQHGPYIGQSHFSLRLTTILPIVASFWTFGTSENALILPTLAIGLVAGCVFLHLTSRVCRNWEILLPAVLMFSVPIFALSNSIAGVDLIELLFDFGSLALF